MADEYLTDEQITRSIEAEKEHPGWELSISCRALLELQELRALLAEIRVVMAR